ncbi:MAG: serine/threonine-protein kinase [Acidobacteria bacterium]|nr:serine/threonine-protein kinase [Acidobacteriota bacterium]
MTLTAGARLGPYEILSAVGAGGMGEVYRARDPRLRRDVAIKVLPVAFSTDADRLHRFEQEARAAAALNHPSILAVFDIGRDAGAPFIVSELLEGATLRDRQAGAVPVRKAVAYAVAIARGLAAAHEKGITHRDLKPENLFITTDDHVKILDFGLAKLTSDPSAESALETVAHTEPGAVLGTVGYMSPEQVRGLAVDHRADLFALGAVLYELVSGQRAFRRDTAAETMAAILNEHPPDLRATGRPIPPALTRIIERCLEKSPTARFQTASDLAFALDALSDASGSAGAVGVAAEPRRRGWIAWGAAALLLVTLAPLAYQRVRERPAAVPLPMRFQIPPIVDLSGPGNFSVSPDGRYLAFFGVGADGIQRIWIRALDSLEVRSLPGSEAFGTVPPPFWSPDSRFLAFDAGGKLKKLDMSGGPPHTLRDLPSLAVGGSWNRDGDIIVGSLGGGLLRVRETGGVVSPVTVLDRARKEEFHLLPTFLSDGRHFVYLRISPSAPEAGATYIGTLDAKPDEQSATRLLPYAVGVTYAPATDSGPGHLLFLREGTLLAQPFDSKRLALAGNPVPVAERVGSFRDSGFFSASANDRLIYRTADTDFQLAWFDRQGTLSSRVSEPGGFRGAALSPDGTRAVASRPNPQDTAKADLWLLDLSSGSGATRFTFGAGLAELPVWSPDGKRIAFTFNKSFVHQKLASGEGDETDVLQSPPAGGVTANGWSPDSQFLLYAALADLTTKSDLWVLPSEGRKPVPFVRTEFDEEQGRFSPNGRWIAYVSNQSGAIEVYVRAFTTDFSGGSASTGGSVLVSRGGGSAPRWRGDGRELYYLAPDGKMMAADVSPGPEFRAGAPTPLFQIQSGAIVGDVSVDGKRFLLVIPAGPSATPPFTVVLNWTAGLKK